MTSRKEKFGLLAACFLVFGVLAVRPVDRETWWIESSVPFLELLALVIYFRWLELSRLSCHLIFIHLVVQMIGGHYTYAEVPLFNWLRDALHGSRNHYDRLAHFMLGFCLYLPIREICLRRTPLAASRRWAAFFTLTTIAALAGLWEVWEWIVAAAVHPEVGAAYLGSQGDPWDAQKDILLAPIGALAAAGLLTRWHDRQLVQAPPPKYGSVMLRQASRPPEGAAPETQDPPLHGGGPSA